MSKKKGTFVFRFSYDIVAKNEGDANRLFQAEIDTQEQGYLSEIFEVDNIGTREEALAEGMDLKRRNKNGKNNR